MIVLNSDEDYYDYQGDPYLQCDADDSIISASTIELTTSLPSTYSTKPPKMDKGIHKWLTRLSPEERQLVLSDTCPEFTHLLAEMLKSHESSKGRCLISAFPSQGKKLLDVSQIKIYQPTHSPSGIYSAKCGSGLFLNGAMNVPVYEALLFSEVRLFTKDAPLDSITVGYKLVEDIQFLMDCFRYISNDQCFQPQSLAHEKLVARGGTRRKGKDSRSVFQDFPPWFGTKIGYTIYQWLVAYFEHLVCKRYQLMNSEGEAGLFERHLSSIRQAFIEHNNVAKFWENTDRRKVLPEVYKRLSAQPDKKKEDLVRYKKFMLYACTNANPIKFVDSLYFSPLSVQSIIDLSYTEITEVMLGLMKEKYRDDIALQLVKEEEEEKKSKDASSKIKQKHAKKKGNKKEKEEGRGVDYELELELEEYDGEYWQSFEFYKQFFDNESTGESLVVIAHGNYERARKKKKKNKKVALTATRHASDATSNDYSSTTASNDNPKTIDSVPEDLSAQAEYEEYDRLEGEEILVACPPAKPVEIKAEDADSKPSEVKGQPEEPKVLVDEKPEPPQVKDTTTKTKKKKKKHRKPNKINKKTIEEYEEFKEKTLQLFANLTGSTAVPKKPPKSKKGYNPVPKAKNLQKKPDTNNNGADCVSSHSGTAASHASDFVTSSPEFCEEFELNYDEELYDQTGEDWPEEEPFEKHDEGEAYVEENEIGKGPMVVLSPYVGNLLESKFFDKLNNEITTLITSTAEHNKNVWRVAEKLQETFALLAREVLNGKKITASVYGSAATGLALTTSDIDVAICGVKPDSKETMIQCMETLAQALSEKGIATEVQVIQSASVPVIKTVIDLGKVNPEWKGETNKVDITFDDFLDNEHPVHYGVLFTEWVKLKKAELSHFVPLVILAKKLLSLHELNIPYYGGLSSYVLILMVSAFLRTCPGCPTVGHSFVEFLRYYAQDFNSAKMFIDRGEIIIVLPAEFLKTADLLVLDPFRLGINSARNLTRFSEIKGVFGETYDKTIELVKRHEDGEDLKGIIDMIL